MNMAMIFNPNTHAPVKILGIQRGWTTASFNKACASSSPATSSHVT